MSTTLRSDQPSTIQYAAIEPKVAKRLQPRHAAFAAVLIVGVLLRVWGLGLNPLWADEAESSINALTILEHGYPTSTYLGVPIYENTLVQRWPDNPEFEFRDSSYSKKGIAVYHGWLPLYSIALSFKMFGVHPDLVPAWNKKLSLSEWHWRSMAARIPSVLMGIGLMVTLFHAGKILAGRETAWSALVLAALVPAIVDCNRQARYYSAALLFSALCALFVWQMSERGKWRDFVAGAVAFVLLFHSHMVLFVAAILLLAVRSLAVLRLPRGIAKVSVFGGILFIGIFPWALTTGLFQTASALPNAYHFLQLRDVIGYPLHKFTYTLVILGGLAAILIHQFYPNRLSSKINAAIQHLKRPYLFVVAWLAISYGSFVFLIPAASFFLNRMPIVVGAPGILLVAMVFSAVARAFRPRLHLPVAVGVSTAFALTAGLALPPHSPILPLQQTVAHLQNMHLGPDVKLYAMPNNHLVLTFYTGLPFESSAPVRKTFFDQYPGRIVIAEPLYAELGPTDPAAPGPLEQTALGAGLHLPAETVKSISDDLATHDYRLEQAPNVCRVSPAPTIAEIPPFAATTFEEQRALNRERLQHLLQFAEGLPVTRGIPVRNVVDVWCAFFYRFVNPTDRMGAKLNYADRLKSSTLTTVGDRWAVYDIPPKDVGCLQSNVRSHALSD